MSSHPPGFTNILHLLVREARRRLLLAALLFSAVALGALGFGLLLPKTWECSASLVPDASAIKPLMQGRPDSMSAESQIASAVRAVQTRKIMQEILTLGGWLTSHTSPQEEEILLAQLRSRLRIDNAHDVMIRISYRDTDAKRAFMITDKMVGIMIREAANAKRTSSREAYDFVERQVKDYGGELASAHEKLLAYYRTQGAPTNATVEPEDLSPEATSARSASHQPRRISSEELAKLRSEEATLAAQLARGVPNLPTAPASPESNRAEEQLRNRVEQLRFEYEHLANSYTERHPDVVRKGNDLETVRQDLRRLEAARMESERAKAATSALDEQVARAARTRLEEVRAQIGSGPSSGSARAPRPRPSAVARPAADNELVDPDMRRVGQDSKLSDLLRRYETTRDVYQDLLKKREIARLSLNLDVERSDVILRVQEPPTMPVIASGLRVMHKSIIGIVLATAVPLGVLFAMVTLDGRVRIGDQIERVAQVPLLVTIPFAASGKGHRRERMHKVLSLLLVAAVFAAYAVAYLITRTKVPR